MINLENIFDGLNYDSYFNIDEIKNLLSVDTVKIDDKNESVFEKVDPNNKDAYLPELNDLARIHYLITKFKCIKVLEFGVGYSSTIIADALSINSKKFSKEVKKLRTDGIFKLYSVDSSEEWIDLTYKNFPNHLKQFSEMCFSLCKTTLVNNKITTQYVKLPNIRPDFIYIDGPSQWDGITESINGVDTKNIERMPVSSDIIIIEYFLTPGTIIYIDGRTTNARFLKNNLQRNWTYHHFIDEDVHVFFLDETPLGKHNENHLNFIFS